MGQKFVVYNEYIPKKHRTYLSEFYSSLSPQELCQEYLQPYCSNCQDAFKESGFLPQHCFSCETYRHIDSPLMIELKKRGLTEPIIWRAYEHFIQYA